LIDGVWKEFLGFYMGLVGALAEIKSGGFGSENGVVVQGWNW
jgi:hypothetical protein